MPHPEPLPDELGRVFSVAAARSLGVSAKRLRGRDLQRPFHGVRTRLDDEAADPAAHPFERLRQQEEASIRALVGRLVPGQFFSHRSAALLWGAPLPPRRASSPHISVHSPHRAPRVTGAVGHHIAPERCRVETRSGAPVSDAAATWAMLGAHSLSISELVAAGDYLARRYREGYGRPTPGRPPLTTIGELRGVVALGRWTGATRLKAALELIREDSWSPRETFTRLMLVAAGLPEPELNVDIYDDRDYFLGCLDLVYRRYRVAIEYHGERHALTYAEDVERIAAVRALGWHVIEITKTLARRPAEATARVREALVDHGWAPGTVA